ncbi:hypothetical protein E2F46_04735 [Luteimonas aestuarii]|uniref:Uncharacterized protein n=1 Tax=Luteimonas aestuarii TaxID=453837 RepID=A0A4R5U1V1_9GAMM|nr:hypothetical protein [Luteimonas aestuarii]TDK27502.1 hypothetical protein E2F46_04735 [Luteimonas aestuarii]
MAGVLALLSMLAPAWAGDEAPVPFITRTHVVIPKAVADYVLEGTSYDARNRFNGVSMRYARADHPETRFDIFVYAAGRMPAQHALDKGMRDFRATFKVGEERGYYSDMRITEDAAFTIDPSDADGTGSTDPGVRVDPADPLPADLQMLILDERIHGQRMKLAYVHLPSGLPMRSRGYLFYRHLHFFKGRVSAAEERIDEDAFSTLTDHAMRTLVPAISALNVGGCATIDVFVPPEGREDDASRKATQRSLVSGLVAARDGNCTGKEDGSLAALGEDVEVVTIEYQPGDWSSR